jgi:hypothetical protein
VGHGKGDDGRPGKDEPAAHAEAPGLMAKTW